MKLRHFLYSLVICTASGQLAFAQTTDATKAEAKDLVAEKTSNSDEKRLRENDKASVPTKSKISKKGSSEVFIPTEEISEDKPVAFPVDI